MFANGDFLSQVAIDEIAHRMDDQGLNNELARFLSSGSSHTIVRQQAIALITLAGLLQIL